MKYLLSAQIVTDPLNVVDPALTLLKLENKTSHRLPLFPEIAHIYTTLLVTQLT